MDEADLERQKQFIIDFIASHPLATVSTISAEGVPSSAAVYIGARSTLECYFGTRSDTQKYQDILQNEHVSLVFVDESTLETVQLRGAAHTISEINEVREAMVFINKIASKEKTKWKASLDEVSQGVFKVDVSRFVPPVAQLSHEPSVYIKIKPNWVRYRLFDADWKTGKKFTEYLLSNF